MAIIKKLLKTRWFVPLLGVVLIIMGLMLATHYAIGAFNAYRAIEFARQNNFDEGNPDPALIRPWMNIRYVAVAYTVPQEYLFAELDIPMERRNSDIPLFDLNDQFDFGRSQRDDERPYPAIIDALGEAIIKYRQDPVPTGLREGGVRPWMSIQYIANSTGIPPAYIFEQVDIPMDDSAFIPLERLARDVRYEPGLRALVEQIQQIVDTYQESPQ